MSSNVSKAEKYLTLLKEGGEPAVWNAMPRRERVYARELVSKFGWTVHMAIQTAFIWLPCKETRDFIRNERDGSVDCYRIDGRTGRIGSVFTEREETVERLVRKFGYTVAEAEASCDRRGIR